MASTAPIPVLLCGKIPSHVQATTDILKPEYRVIKVCTDPAEARAAVTALLSPSIATPSIDGTDYPRPRIVIMGGGYSPQVFSEIYDNVDGAKTVPWIRPVGTKPDGPGLPAGPPPAEEIAGRVRKALDEHSEEIENGKGAGEVWWM
ncbi:hypothetical protein JX265_008774 [Neoarthrinium moseri]|uniref:Uncharacterized protein n=1 Tax=Neoarthrinium moseri TaxID=1658444 RepID=A0A9Q0ALV0_9PEZI|nr:uncharacterized protein JN550_009492 [Neoarthrinium moseri]KAI1848444.1 hypothetical protein JX266_005750 [Neoarthrinium moseri]KAI1863381.1 hypothetical protein JN550_009492 [Neoarthrinium moseri]KAI1863557.1 hypothetical protein JX265_008774 [Neoarthrinium moseri]